jgi:hypothetical protein
MRDLLLSISLVVLMGAGLGISAGFMLPKESAAHDPRCESCECRELREIKQILLGWGPASIPPRNGGEGDGGPLE